MFDSLSNTIPYSNCLELKLRSLPSYSHSPYSWLLIPPSYGRVKLTLGDLAWRTASLVLLRKGGIDLSLNRRAPTHCPRFDKEYETKVKDIGSYTCVQSSYVHVTSDSHSL